MSRRKAVGIRIVGGRWRGRRLPVPAAAGLRPSTDRTRETLFNWLAPVLPQAHCLDLFAGTGILGLEALSRGAHRTLFIERDARIAGALQRWIAQLEAPAAVQIADALRFLSGRAERRFDIVFLDPPYRSGLLAPTLEALCQGHWLAPGATIYLEHGDSEEEEVRPPTQTELLRQAHIGQSRLALLRACHVAGEETPVRRKETP
ncbi:16S rRNA (guanine(966)-N(2))-methyltransferase RsmD [Halorhodospira abdelmalekii]|uniref:16S rRNA (guanine(966)-N(2))-methyltransferase RsmD n=1 Tax=Halorhodospira abdelmalekii TaxID=421629 RepID=UPI003084483B